jgi:hypothetical protein
MSQTTTTTDRPTPPLEEVVEMFLAAYNEPDADRRRELVAGVFALDGSLVEPPLDATGPAAISDLMGTVQGHFPDHRFARTTGIDAHHNLLRYGWELVDPQGATALTGIDVAELDEFGTVRRMVGFLGELPPRD